MKRTEMTINGHIIRLYNSNEEIILKEKAILENLNLIGNEFNDRILIQKCIDDNKIKSQVTYDGSTVYSFDKTVRLYRQLQKSDSLENLTTYMYDFFTLACDDIAHYNIGGYKCHYNYSIRELEDRWLKNIGSAMRFGDRDRIFKELKIGSYFNDREFIDIDKISTHKLKSIIENVGWKVEREFDTWILKKNLITGGEFSFKVDISNNKVSQIVSNIKEFYNSFDKEKLIESMVEKRKQLPNSPTISEIVSSVDNIKDMLSKMVSDVIYKSRLESELKQYSENKNNNIIASKDYIIDEEYLDICG